MTPDAIEWHLNGEHGVSSLAIFNYLHFGNVGGKWFSNWPHDPDDLRRCEILLRAVPLLRRRFSEMRDVHPVWSALVDHWEGIVECMEQEVPGIFESAPHGSAPKSYALMRSVIDAAERAA